MHPGTKPDCSKLGKLCTLASHSDDQNGTSEDKGMIVHSVLSVGGVDSLVDKKLIKVDKKLIKVDKKLIKVDKKLINSW